MNDKKKAALLWQQTLGYRAEFLIAILAMAVGYLFMFGVPLVMKYTIDALDTGSGADLPAWLAALNNQQLLSPDSGKLALLATSGLGIVGLTLISGLFLFVRGRSVAIASEGITRALRDKVFNHLEHLPSSYHDKADTGDLVQRCTSDVETVRVFLAAQVVEIARAILMLIVVLPILISLDVNMTWLSMATMPFLCIFAVVFFRKVKDLFLEVDESEARMTTVLQENLTGIRVVRAFARQAFEIEKFSVRNKEFRDLNTHLIKLLGFYYALSDLFCLGQIGALLIVGALWVVDGQLSVGTLFAFLTYVGMIIWPIRHMGRVLTDAGKAVVSMGRLAEVLMEPIESQHEEYPGKLLQGKIEFLHLTFGYDPLRPVLQDISFSIEPGQTLALIGPPGSGKSTIVQLLMRLYDYTDGSIAFDDIELSGLARKFVRSQISIVMQEPFLYSATIGANLQVGRMDATFDEVQAAARAACIHDSIMGFPRQYDTLVGERGATLSGGQRQRIALARALLKDPPILILDDSLSAVDTDTEARILEALKSRRRQHSTIIVSHRLSSVMHADKILMLDQGRIVQEGTHETLSTTPGIYQHLCQIQGAIQQEIESDLSALALSDTARDQEEGHV